MKTADKVFANDRHWREAKSDERRLILEEYVTDLRKREEVSAMDKLFELHFIFQD